MSEKDIQSDLIYPPPDCVHMNNHAREEFLSQQGNFSPQERAVFHRICARWQPEIPYHNFITNLDIKNGSSDLNSLMTKLRKQRMGTITYKIEDGFRKPESIVLTPKDALLFYMKMVDEHYIHLQETLSAPLPYETELLPHYPELPKDQISTIDYLDLLRMIADHREPYPAIFRIPVQNSDALLASTTSIKWIIHAAVGKLRAFFGNPNYLEMAAKILNTSLLEVKNQLATRNPEFWRDFTTHLLAEEATIKTNRSVKVGKRFFQICDFICRYVDSQIALTEEQRLEREDRELDMRSLLQAAKEDSNKILTEEYINRQIDGLKDKYKDSFAEFKAEFISRYIKASSGLPILIQIQHSYVHIDNLFPLFNSRMETIRPELHRHYTKLMEKQLRTSNRDGSEVFFSKENFELDILESIRRIDEFLAHCLERPNIISEAMVHNLKQRKKVRTSDDLRNHLMVFFQARTLLFLPMAEIFNLNLGIIFYNGFTRLPLWKQITIRLLGRYRALEEKYIGRSFTTYKRIMQNEQKARKELMPKSQKDSATARVPKNQKKSSAAPASTREIKQKNTAIQAARRRGYNQNEREEAWRKFGDTLKS